MLIKVNQPIQLDLIEVLDQAKAPEYHATMVAANIDIFFDDV
jgi:hypothetical protein